MAGGEKKMSQTVHLWETLRRPGAAVNGNWRSQRPPENEFYVPEEAWEQLCYAVAHGENVLVTGPSGCGKSELYYRVTHALGCPASAAFNFGAMSEPRTSLIGNTHFNPQDGTWFSESRFVRAIRTPKACLLLDEINRANRDAFNILLPLFDSQGYLALDESEQGSVVRRAVGVVFYATANIGLEYTGADQIDKALKDRFPVVVALDFPPADKEQALLTKHCVGLSGDDAARLVRLASRQRELAAEGEFVEKISTRALLAAGRQIASGISLARAVQFCLLNHFPTDGGTLSERTKLAQLFQKG